MRWGGLSILDATKIEREHLSKDDQGDDQIFLYRAKTGVPVSVVIPPDVADLLRSVPNDNPRYFFWSGNGDPRSARNKYGAFLMAMGLSIGLPVSFLLGRVLSSVLGSIKPMILITSLEIAGVLVIVSALTCYLPPVMLQAQTSGLFCVRIRSFTVDNWLNSWKMPALSQPGCQNRISKFRRCCYFQEIQGLRYE